MAGLGGVGVNMSDSKSTGRQQQRTIFPKQFIDEYHNTFGGPFTMDDLMNTLPRAHSMFGFGEQGPIREGGGYNLGFGSPRGLPPGAGGPATGDDGTMPAPGGSGLGSPAPPAPTSGQSFKWADLQNSYAGDPDKLMDIPRLFRQAKIDPNNFTAQDFQTAMGNARKYGFSGRSQKNFAAVLADLQSSGDVQNEFGGGKGSGIF